MMNSLFLCALAAFALPSVIAISCYQCTPKPPSTMCTSNVNSISCDKPPGAPPGMKYDACDITSYQLTKGEENTAMNYMRCGVKSMCDTWKEKACNQTFKDMTVKKCEFRCCFEDNCNKMPVAPPTGGTDSKSAVPPTTTGPTSKGRSNGASFIATSVIAGALLAGNFFTSF